MSCKVATDVGKWLIKTLSIIYKHNLWYFKKIKKKAVFKGSDHKKKNSSFTMSDLSYTGTFAFIWVVSWMIQPFKEAVWMQVRQPKPANSYWRNFHFHHHIILWRSWSSLYICYGSKLKKDATYFLQKLFFFLKIQLSGCIMMRSFIYL